MKIIKILDKLLKLIALGGLHYFCIAIISGLLFMNCEKHEPESNKQLIIQKSDTLELKTSVDLDECNKIDLCPLLSATQSHESAISFDLDSFLATTANLEQDSSIWPIYIFLLSEVYRLRGNKEKALSANKLLVEWALRDPYGDGWGGCAVVSVALWRWLVEMSAVSSPDAQEVNYLIRAADSLRETRMVRNMFKTPLLYAIPQLEEDIVRRMALVAWSANQTELAERFFLEYLTISRSAELGFRELKILQHLIDTGLASHDRLFLLRGKRLKEIGKDIEAYKFIEDARKSEDLQVRSEASFHLAGLELKLHESKKGKDRTEVADLLDFVFANAADPDIAQEALYDKAQVLYREGPGCDTEQSERDLLKLIDEFPRGRFADDALFQLTRSYQIKGDVETALSYFKKLQNFEGKNDWLGTASFQMAMSLYTRGQEHDLKQASEILKKLERRDPYGPFHLIALFWLGRIASETSHEEIGKEYFQDIIEQSPYDFYAIRARMHLQLGIQAKTKFRPDSTTFKMLRAEYKSSRVDTSITKASPYHIRLLNTLKTGLYNSALVAEHRLLQELEPPARLEDISLAELDQQGSLTHCGLLLALRQDALAAKDNVPTSENRLQIAGTVEHFVKDFPLVMELVIASSEHYPDRWAAQLDKRYLATAYPVVYRQAILEASQKHDISPHLLYAIMRRESAFYPAALSAKSALGLFQFLPDIFKTLDLRWELLRSTGSKSREEFLLNPDLSIDLGARYFKEELLKRQKGNILFAIIEHNAGYAATQEWIKHWEGLGRDCDIEYMIETFRFASTRNFIRRVITDMIIIEASNTLNPDSNF